MGRRKGRTETPETLNPEQGENDQTPPTLCEAEGEEERAGKGGRKFYSVYLLTSLSPRFKGSSYIGFTVNPRRRIRQHNGEIGSGAWRTKKRRPWEMVLCIYGFPTNVAALQFEWAWQHPLGSLAVRKAAATFKSLSGLANKIKLAYTMLTLPSWQSLNLRVNYFSTKYMTLTSGCPSLPEQMRVQFGSMDELPCYTGGNLCAGENDDWDPAGDDCEHSGGSEESAEDGSADAQPLSNIELVQDGFKETENLGLYNWTEAITHQQQTSTESSVFELPKNLQISKEEAQKQSFQLDDFLGRISRGSVFSCSNATRIAEDTGTFRLYDEFNVADPQLPRQQSVQNVTLNKFELPCTSSEVEVIDLSTPSPCYNVSTGNKKRKLSVGCPEIIDLTNSPMFV
ncbi:uncharacterized protein LOC113777869 [Coffea eugenioides]|uniref:uncharacterized protein LOC113777869 n=1 Tax=Coffea eugenioides TaxID=49369 RepID=UPI000F60921B|nr:uncharacterized protein LOC113777869 [Coffea eugenioides]